MNNNKLELLPHAEFTREFAAYKAEATRRMYEMAELMGVVEGKAGRPAANPLAKLLKGGVAQETDPDAANGAVQ